MKEIKHRFIVGFLLLSVIISIQAGQQPLFSFTPLTPTTISIPNNTTRTVQYQVTNNTKITRTLTVIPLTGATQSEDLKRFCSNPFTLLAHQSCTLTLKFSGPVLAAASNPSVIGGPVVCKTMGNGNNEPDSNLCSQPSVADSLNVTLSGVIEDAVISTSVASIVLFTGGSSEDMLITNTSTDVAATNIAANFAGTALAGNVTATSSNCANVDPGGQCTITYTPSTNFVADTSFPIKGDNTNTITGDIVIYLGELISCNSIPFIAGPGTPPTISCTGAGFSNYVANTAKMELISGSGACATGAFSGNPPVIDITTINANVNPNTLVSGSGSAVQGQSFNGCNVRMCTDSNCSQYTNTVEVK